MFRVDNDVSGVRSRLHETIVGLSGLVGALAYMPIGAPGDHPFARDGEGPPLALQIDFETSHDRDAALESDGALARLVSAFPSADVVSQCLSGRRFPVPEPVPIAPAREGLCTFLVEYPGTAVDLEAWLDHYDAHHPPIMARFPGVREVATFRPAPRARNHLPGGRVASMQRNKVVFDSPRSLVDALTSPVMSEMRADAARFLPFTGKATHFPMATTSLLDP